MLSLVYVVVIIISLCNPTNSATLNCSPILNTSSCPGNEFHCECQSFGFLTWTFNQSELFYATGGGCNTRYDVFPGIEVILCSTKRSTSTSPVTIISSFNVTLTGTLYIECRNFSSNENRTIHLPSELAIAIVSIIQSMVEIFSPIRSPITSQKLNL